MSKSLHEYVDWLGHRDDLIWPKPPQPKPLKATPFLNPLEGIRAVTFSVYGTLLRIDSGRLVHEHPQRMRMQIALEKTIEEFNMWHAMSRKPGAPWEYMLQKYHAQCEERRLQRTKRKGDAREIDSRRIWAKLLDRLRRNEYTYDSSFYGNWDDLAGKVAYFFHACLQGVAAADAALDTLRQLAGAGICVGLIDDGQAFTMEQLSQALARQGSFMSVGEFITADCVTLSYELAIRKPSPSLFAEGFAAILRHGGEPANILHVSHRLHDDIAVAKQFGVRTALLAADANACQVTGEDVRDPEMKPDRLLTDLRQIGHILGI